MVLTLYSVSDGPPSVAVRMCLKKLGVSYKLVEVDYVNGEFLTDNYAKMNPQKEIPVLDDDGFYLSESNAILQYLGDKYDSLYPRDVKARALVNHRLAFNMSTYYSAIGSYVMLPILFKYERTPVGLQKVRMALDVFNTYLLRLKSKYSAGDSLTIADFPLVSATSCLEAINFDFLPYPEVARWYRGFKEENPEIWSICQEGMNEVIDMEKSPPKLSFDHPIHPLRE